MMNKLSRREFLRISAAAAAAGVTLKACGPAPEPTDEPTDEPAEVPTSTVRPSKTVTLEIEAWEPEYLDAERQIWDLFEQEHGNIKVELFSINEDQIDAYKARIAGGYRPAMMRGHRIADFLVTEWESLYVDLTTIDGLALDQYTADLNGLSNDFYGYNLRMVTPFAPFVWTWMYHKDLMDQAGLEPRENVRTWDELREWLAKGTAWANSNPDVDFFWDQAGPHWMPARIFPQYLPVAFPEGQYDRINACYLGQARFNDPDSPFRRSTEFVVEAYQSGWLPDDFLTRTWDTDMETSYIAKKSVMMFHGPWPWDKALSIDPTVQQSGYPLTPPAEGQEQWMQFRGSPTLHQGYAVLEGAQELDEWEEIQTAFAWYHQPEIVELRSQIYGLNPLVHPSEGFELDSPQWHGIMKEIDTPGGEFEHVKFTQPPYGEDLIAAKLLDGAPGVFSNLASDEAYAQWNALFANEMSVQEYLDKCQENYEKSYDFS